MKGENTFHFADQEMKISVEHEDGFITGIKMNAGGENQELLDNLQEQLKWVQLNPVALYTRMRFFILKYNVSVNFDLNKLAKAIAESARD